MLTNILHWLGFSSKKLVPKKGTPLVIPRPQHKLSRASISKQALKVLYGLKDAGYQAYLVGGGVRDVLLGKHPKDFDVATNAHPEQVQKLFRNCRLIGRRFRLAHVHFGSHIVEVATFRGNPSEHSHEGMILRDNIYGTLEEDAWRRDFTINALYYNIADYSLIDYVGGLQDLQARHLRMIGDAEQRYREDPVRMLRAIRFSAKLGFAIYPDTEAPLFNLSHLVKQVPSARLFDEYIKLFLTGCAEESFRLLRHYGLFAALFPQTEHCLQNNDKPFVETFVKMALMDTDKRFIDNKPVTLPFLLAAFLWGPIREQLGILMSQGMSELQALHEASDYVLNEQQKCVAISRRVAQQIREIWVLQIRLTSRLGRRAKEYYTHPRFRAAYDFLILRARGGEKSAQHFSNWWKEYAGSDEETRLGMVNTLTKAPHSKGRKRHRRFDKRLVSE